MAQANIVPGLKTPVYGYAYIDDLGVKRPVRVPGPIIDVDRTDATNLGLPVKVRVINRLPDTHPQFGHDFKTSTHLHGSASLPQYDGYADDVTYPGFYKDYWYPNFQDARTLWYHDHGVHHTAQNAYGGLAAQYHLHDRVQERDLPKGVHDVGITIHDAMFSADGKLAYHDNQFSGLWGDVILVNGQPWPYMEVTRRVWRFRILNASIARSLRLHLSDNSEFAIVGTDGGLMPAPARVREYRHAGAERYELLIDFSQYAAGTKVQLLNRSNLNNKDYDHTNKIMEFRVVGTAPANLVGNTMTPRLPVHEVMSIPVNEAKRTRVFELDHDDVTNEFKINHKTWSDVVKSGYTEVLTGGITPAVGDVEIWEFQNKSGGWFHPLHIHLVDFKILSRNGQAARPYENGPKDVVYIGEDEIVRLLIKFNAAPGSKGGKYMVHCHNLPHEDHDMMQQFAVGQVPDDYDDAGAASSAPRPRRSRRSPRPTASPRWRPAWTATSRRTATGRWSSAWPLPRAAAPVPSTRGPALRRVLGLVLLLLVVLLGRAFVAEPVRISSDSMAPTLLRGDVVLVDRRAPRRGRAAQGRPRRLRQPADRRGVAQARRRPAGRHGGDHRRGPARERRAGRRALRRLQRLGGHLQRARRRARRRGLPARRQPGRLRRLPRLRRRPRRRPRRPRRAAPVAAGPRRRRGTAAPSSLTGGPAATGTPPARAPCSGPVAGEHQPPGRQRGALGPRDEALGQAADAQDAQDRRRHVHQLQRPAARAQAALRCHDERQRGRVHEGDVLQVQDDVGARPDGGQQPRLELGQGRDVELTDGCEDGRGREPVRGHRGASCGGGTDVHDHETAHAPARQCDLGPSGRPEAAAKSPCEQVFSRRLHALGGPSPP